MRTKDIVDHLEKLMTLSTVSETGSIRQASEVLGISQPSLSTKIKTLENILGFEVFQRSQSGIQPTNKGQMVLDFVKKTHKNAEDLKSQLESPPGLLSGHIRIGAYDSIARFFWPGFYKRLKKKYPNVSITLFTGRSSELIAKLSRQEIDIALTAEAPKSGDIFQRTLYSDHYSCYAHKNMVLDQERFIQKKKYYELSSDNVTYDLILFTQALKDLNAQYGQYHYKFHEVESFEVSLQFCLQGIGMTILPHRVAQQEFDKDKLKKVLLTPQLGLDFNEHNIVLSTNRQAQSQAATAAVFEEISLLKG